MSEDNKIVYCSICTEEIEGEIFNLPDEKESKMFLCEECYDIYVNVISNKKSYANKYRGK